MTALQVGTVLASVNIIAGGLSALPLHVMERVIKDHRISKKIALSHPLYDALLTEPNPEMSAFTLKKTLQVHALLWGNAYAEIERNNANEIVSIWPRNPARTRPVRTTKELKIEGDTLPPGTLIYTTADNLHGAQISFEDKPGDNLGTRRIVLAEDMIHITGLSLDGRIGQGTVYLARQIIGLSLAAEKFGAKFFGNGAIPAGVLTLAGKLEDRALENLRRSWAEAYGGENRWKTAVLEQGVKYEKVGSTPNEGQFLETRRAQRIEIAAVFNVPPHMIGEAEKTKSNVEQSSIEFVLYTLGPWIAQWENELRRKLFPRMGRSAGKFLPKFDTRRLLYPDSDARGKFYSSGKQWGFLSTNDIRELEDMNPVEDGSGDRYWMPTNMQHADDPITLGQVGQIKHNEKFGKKPKSKAVPIEEPGLNPKKPTGKRDLERYIAAFTPIVRDAMGRLVHREQRDATIAARIMGPVIACVGEVLSADGVLIVDSVEVFAAQWINEGGFAARSTEWKAKSLDSVALAETTRLIEGLTESRAVDPALYFLRHGSTPHNADDRYREWTDVDLDERGREIVKQAAQPLKGKGIKRIIATNLKRGRTTAGIVADELGGIPIEYTDALNTWKHGFGGKTRAEAGDQVKYFIDHPDETPPNGESLNHFVERNQAELDDLQKRKKGIGSLLSIASGSNLSAYNRSSEEVAEALNNHALVGPGGLCELEDDGSVVVLFEGDKDQPQKPS